MRAVAFGFVFADGDIDVEECSDHRGNLVANAECEVAHAVAAVNAARAVFFVPELVAPANQCDFEALDHGEPGAHLEAGLRPGVVPVVVQPSFYASVRRIGYGVVVPGGERGAHGEGDGQKDLFKHPKLLGNR